MSEPTFGNPVIKAQDLDKQAALIKADAEVMKIVFEKIKTIKLDPALVQKLKEIPRASPVELLMEIFPALNQFFPVPKVCIDDECWSWGQAERVITQDLLTLILHLNDVHQLPREQVADWLESLDVDLTFGSEHG